MYCGTIAAFTNMVLWPISPCSKVQTSMKRMRYLSAAKKYIAPGCPMSNTQRSKESVFMIAVMGISPDAYYQTEFLRTDGFLAPCNKMLSFKVTLISGKLRDENRYWFLSYLYIYTTDIRSSFHSIAR